MKRKSKYGDIWQMSRKQIGWVRLGIFFPFVFFFCCMYYYQYGILPTLLKYYGTERKAVIINPGHIGGTHSDSMLSYDFTANGKVIHGTDNIELKGAHRGDTIRIYFLPCYPKSCLSDECIKKRTIRKSSKF